MAAISSVPSSRCCVGCRISRGSSRFLPTSLRYPSSPSYWGSFRSGSVLCNNVMSTNRWMEGRGVRVAVAEESVVSQGGEDQSSVSVPISPSDVLTMFFKAEGTMDDSAISVVKNLLEEVEGVGDLKVGTLEGIATVELTKQTTVQATGVASNLVEIIQGSGSKLQTLNLSFQDEEDIIQ